MKECLNCKKEFTAKKDTAKYCSVSCRVMWNRKQVKKEMSIKESKIDVLLKKIDALESKINFAPTTNTSADSSKLNRYIADEASQWPTPKPSIVRSFEYYKEARMECASDEDWRELRAEIISSNLTPKQKTYLTT